MTKTAIISVDGHAKASRRQYRDYVDPGYRDLYDQQVRAAEEAGLPDTGNLNPDFAPEVQWDSDARTAALEQIGVVAEILFSNGQPFQINRLDDFAMAADQGLAEAGRTAYNRWLADFCAESPGRRSGQMQLDLENVEQSVADVHWAKEHGLGGVALPAINGGGRFYFDPALDPVWAACEETGLVVSQHGALLMDPEGPPGGWGFAGQPSGFGALMLITAENAFFSNRSLWMLIAGGVFDRFPALKAAWIETTVYYLAPTLKYLERVLDSGSMSDWGIESTMKERPTDYFGRNLFIGLSPFGPGQDSEGTVLGRDRDGGTLPGFRMGIESLMYGVDFPHFETCYQRNWGEVASLVTAPIVNDSESEGVLFGTAADVYGFDRAALQPHVERVGFDLEDIRRRADELKADMPEMNTSNITGGERPHFGTRVNA